MTTNARSDEITRQLINQLGGIASTPTTDGESRIKAAVMIAYLAGRPAPTETLIPLCAASGHYSRNSASS